MSDRAMMTINEFTDWGCVSRTRIYEGRYSGFFACNPSMMS